MWHIRSELTDEMTKKNKRETFGATTCINQ